MDYPRKVERRTGTLLTFNHRPQQSHAQVRIGEECVMLPTSTRGVLQPDGSIVLCANGDRYNAIPEGTTIKFDVVLDADGKNPVPGLWAPKI